MFIILIMIETTKINEFTLEFIFNSVSHFSFFEFRNQVFEWFKVW